VSPDDRWIIYPTAEVTDAPGIVLLDSETGATSRVSGLVGPTGFTRDARYAIGLPPYDYPDMPPRSLVLLELATRTVTNRAFPSEQTPDTFFTTSAGSYVVFPYFIADCLDDTCPRLTLVYAVETAEFRVIDGGPTFWFGGHVAIPDSGELWFLGRAAPEHEDLYRMDLEAGAVESIALPWRPDALSIAPMHGRVAEEGGPFPVVSLPRLLELKIASGMTAAHRMRDLDDAMRLIAANELSPDYASELDPYVRAKYAELWKLAQVQDDY
jgi:hypothetical protein